MQFWGSITSGWSYHGPDRRCARDDGTPDAEACAARLDRLRSDDEGLRALADAGDRCAFVALMELLVDADRIDDLRALADAGDGRALATLMEVHLLRADEGALRADVDRYEAIAWLLEHLVRHGRADEAVAELDGWLAARPDRRDAWRGRRVDLLLEAGRFNEVRRAAEDGDRAATRRLARLEPGAGPT